MSLVHCTECGAQVSNTAQSCPKCGAGQELPKSPKGFVPVILLCLFFGMIGIHRFYVGKIGTGILMILTLGGFGIWAMIDLIIIIIGSFKDSDGLPIRN
jgi:TM2 domain-containing membrane protein YozV